MLKSAGVKGRELAGRSGGGRSSGVGRSENQIFLSAPMSGFITVRQVKDGDEWFREMAMRVRRRGGLWGARLW